MVTRKYEVEVMKRADVYFPLNETGSTFRCLKTRTSLIGAGVSRVKSAPGLAYGVSFANNTGSALTGTGNELSGINLEGFSLELWIKFPTFTFNRDVRFIHRLNSFFVNWKPTGNNFVFGVRDAKGVNHTIGYAPPVADQRPGTNGWHHYVCTYRTNGDMSIYRDGVRVAHQLGSPGYLGWVNFPTGRRFVINGHLPAPSGSSKTFTEALWPGSVSDVALYMGTLPVAQRAVHSDLGHTSTYVAPSSVATLRSGFRIGSRVGTMVRNFLSRTTFDFDSVSDDSLETVVRAQPWWDNEYLYRMELIYAAPPTGIGAGHPMRVKLDIDKVEMGKVKPSLSDINVIYVEQTDENVIWHNVDAHVESTGEEINVTFPLVYDLDPDEATIGEYFIYYGDKSGLNAIDMRVDGVNEWHERVYPDDPTIGYTRPESDWRDGESLEVDAKASFGFYGDRIRVYSMTGPDKGVASMSINGEYEVDVDLYSVTSQERLVYEQRDLPIGENIFRLRDTGMKSPASSDSKVNFTRIEYGKHSTMDAGAEETSPMISWGSTMGGMTVD